MVSWNSNVNTKAFGMNTGFQDNLVKVQFETGKVRTYMKNSKTKKTYSFSLLLKDDGANSEYRMFLSWYENTLKSGSETFLFPDLITHTGNGVNSGTEYRMTSAPTISGQLYKTVSINVVEE